jgi:ribonuclease G
MKKEIIVNADDLESRVAILEDGELAELTVEREPRMVGSIYKARVMSVLPGMDAAFADIGLEKNVFLCADDVGFVSRDGVTVSPAPRSLTISQRLKEKQEVVVQIVRAPVGGKGARATTRLALPGRYLVMLVSDVRQVGVSRKIEDRKERARLRKIGEKIRPEATGIIIRTEAEGHGRRELEGDLKVLRDLRERLMKKAAQAKAPAILHQDLTLTYQVIRDAFTEDVNGLVIDSKSVYDNAVDLVKSIAPGLRRRVKRYRGKLPIFHKHGIEGEIDRLLRRRVWLAAGGYISIDQAEAFTAIDVNTGRYTGSTGLADTILRTNLEAAHEIARQLRLRDLGGIIVIDFIDMDRSRHRQRVMKTFEEALKRDRQRTKILHLSPLGLIEMTRKRRGESLMGVLTETCPHCAGLGRMRRPVTVALKIQREVRRLAAEEKIESVVVRATPRVAAALIGEDGERSAALDRRVGGPVYIRANHDLGVEEHEITPMTPARAAEAVKVYAEGDEVTVDHLDPENVAAGEYAYGWVDGYRVQIEGGAPGPDGKPVVLTKVGTSFAHGHVKSERPKAEKAKGGERGTQRRTSRKRSRPRRKAKRPKQAAPGAKAEEPASAAAQPAAAPARPAAPARETEAAPPGKKSGLLRRGARRIARARR